MFEQLNSEGYVHQCSWYAWRLSHKSLKYAKNEWVLKDKKKKQCNMYIV